MASESSIRIPPEIITEILYRLPAKSVGRFKCVSKEWLSIISEPQFIKTHQKTFNRTHLIFISGGGDDSLYSVPFQHHEDVPRPTKLVLNSHYAGFAFYGSCNGLVLVSTSLCDQGLPTLVILNPTTMEFHELPKSGYNIVDEVFISSFVHLRLHTAFFKFGIMFGFGYDSLNDDYKVVTVSFLHRYYLSGPKKISVHVYSLRTNTWRWVINSLYDHGYVDTSGVFVNGVLHWLARNYSDCSPIVVAFSLKNEKFSEVPSPDLSSYGDIVAKNECKLVVLGEKLAIFLVREGVVWLMNEYGKMESWTKILLYRLDEIPMDEPMILFENGKIFLVSHDLRLIYDVEERKFCKSKDNSQNLKVWNVRGTYIESLVRPNFHETS